MRGISFARFFSTVAASLQIAAGLLVAERNARELRGRDRIARDERFVESLGEILSLLGGVTAVVAAGAGGGERARSRSESGSGKSSVGLSTRHLSGRTARSARGRAPRSTSGRADRNRLRERVGRGVSTASTRRPSAPRADRERPAESVLPHAAPVARAPQEQEVGLGDPEAVRLALEEAHALEGRLRPSAAAAGDGTRNANPGRAPRPDAAAQLVQRREAEALRSLDHDHGRLRNVEPHLDDHGRDEDRHAAVPERIEDLDLSLDGQAAVQEPGRQVPRAARRRARAPGPRARRPAALAPSIDGKHDERALAARRPPRGAPRTRAPASATRVVGVRARAGPARRAA